MERTKYCVFLLFLGFAQSSIQSNDYKVNQTSVRGNQGPELAVDGDSKTCSQTVGPGRWTAKFGGVFSVKDIVIHMNPRLARLAHQIQVYAGEVFCGELQYEAGATTYQVACEGVPAREVRIVQSQTDLAICEAEINAKRVLGWSGLLHNIAPGFTSWMSTVISGGEAARSNDGNTNSIWSAGSCSHSSNTNNNTWTVDLLNEYVIDRVVIHHRRDGNTGHYINGLEVYVGDLMCNRITYRANVFVYTVKCPPGHRATKVTLLKPTSYLLPCEVQVLATEGSINAVKELNGPILSVEAPTDQSTTSGIYRSALAVDGNTNSYFNGGSCSHTGKNTKNWFKLRLWRRASVRQIKVYKSLSHGAYVHQAKLYVGDVFCGQINHQNAQRVYTFSCGGTIGDTVWVYQDANYLTMCEIEVYGHEAHTGEKLVRLKGGFPTSGGDQDRYKVIDGIKSGRLADRSCTSLTPAKFGVNFLEKYFIKKVVVHTRMDAVDKTTDGAVVKVGDKECGKIEWRQGTYVYEIECGGYAQSVHIEGQGNSFYLCELETLVTESSYNAAKSRLGNNIALEKDTELTRTSGQYTSSLAVDGDTNGILAHKSCAQSVYPGTQLLNQWKVDLMHMYRVKQVHVYPQQDYYQNYLDRAKVYLDDQFCGEIIYWNSIPFYQISCSNMIGRHVRIIGTERYLALCEVEVYGKLPEEDDDDDDVTEEPKPTDASPTDDTTESPFKSKLQKVEKLRYEVLKNVAPGHVTTQSEVYSTGYPAYANDNRTNGIWSHKSCIHTSNVVGSRTSVWWKVQLVFNYNIRKIVIHNRFDSPTYIDQLKVFAGDHLCGQITYEKRKMVYVVNCGYYVHANEVKLVQETPGFYLTICEVEILVPQKNIDKIHANMGENLAFDKPTKQTTTQTPHATQGSYKAHLAVDGSTSGNLNDRTCSKTISNNYYSRWEVNLEGTVMVNVIKIYGAANSKLLDKAKVYVGDEFCTQLFYQPMQSVWMVECGSAVGMTVSVVQDIGQLELCEVEVYGHYVMTNAPLVNIALQKNTQQSSTASGGESARAVDGRPNSYWSRNTCTYTSNTANAYWLVDLLAEYEIKKVVVHISSSHNVAHMNGTEVLAVGAYGTEVFCGQLITETGTFVYSIECPSGLRANEIKLRHEKTYLILCEVEVLATRASVSRVEDSLGWIISRGMKAEQSTIDGTSAAEYAVDGNYTQYHNVHPCAVTQSSGANWWKVEFGELKAVTHVKIYNRLDRYPNYLNTASVYMGEVFCGQILYQAAQSVYTINCHGSVGMELYVRKNSGALQLCEVEARGHSIA